MGSDPVYAKALQTANDKSLLHIALKEAEKRMALRK
jgi:hypothetical protein